MLNLERGDAAAKRAAAVAQTRHAKWVRAARIGLPMILTLALTAAIVHQNGAEQSAPLLASEQDLLNRHVTDWQSNWLRSNPAVLVLEFPGLQAQGQALTRIAALIEKKGGARHRLLSDAELEQLIADSGDNGQTFYLGHDYTGPGLAKFFNLAARQQLVLNTEEQRLRRLLLNAGLLTLVAGTYQSHGVQALVSFTAIQMDDPLTKMDEGVDALRRSSILRHELSHGEFFTNPAYRTHCWEFWRKSLNDGMRQSLRDYLVRLQYSPDDEELIVNETQALLIHTADTRVFRAEDLGWTETELTGIRAIFQHAEPVTAIPIRQRLKLPAQRQSP